jgi:hypothetical protein
MDDKDFRAIDKAIEQYYRYGKITEKCPKCGEVLVITENCNSFEVKCVKDCVKETFRGI